MTPHPRITSYNVCYTKLLRVLGPDTHTLTTALDTLTAGTPGTGVITARATQTGAPAVVVFPGQGSQWAGMGRELWDTSSYHFV
ncbi:hypothetical protein [Streptomyces cyaneogriseus]|uniref:hypothetical protein n=1 Tax=Streptomyces cyaneogriseus TaxID=68192 RepID=UPI001EEFEB12|nr:hypothetical protein [Streptomyces cyaneogriseus]